MVVVMRYFWSRAMIRRASGPGIGVEMRTPRVREAEEAFVTGAVAEAVSLMVNPFRRATRAQMLGGGDGAREP